MPLHLNSIIKKKKEKKLAVDILSKDLNTAEDTFVTNDKIKINGIKKIVDKKTNRKIGQTVFTLMVSEKHIELLDADITLVSAKPIELEFIEKIKGSEANEYYHVAVVEGGQHLEIETVGRYRVDKENLEDTTQKVYLSAFPFQLDIYDNINQLNFALGFKEPIKSVDNLVVHGFGEDFVGCGSVMSNETEPCSFIIGKIKKYEDVNAIIGEKKVKFTIIELETAMGIIPVAVCKDNFDIRKIKNGMILAMLADIKAEFK